MKAVLITKSNQASLGSRFMVDDVLEEIPIGYVLVTDFGNDEKFDLLTVENLNAKFVATGVTLDNGFYEVEQIA